MRMRLLQMALAVLLAGCSGGDDPAVASTVDACLELQAPDGLGQPKDGLSKSAILEIALKASDSQVQSAMRVAADHYEDPPSMQRRNAMVAVQIACNKYRNEHG